MHPRDRAGSVDRTSYFRPRARGLEPWTRRPAAGPADTSFARRAPPTIEDDAWRRPFASGALPGAHPITSRPRGVACVTPVELLVAIFAAVALAAGVGAAVAVLTMRRAAARRRGTSHAGDAAPTDADGDPDHESFGYIVSHDLRAPIRVVEGFTKIVKEDYGAVLDTVGHDHLDRVLGAAARMNSMIDSLLALSRLSSQPITRVPVNLSQIAGFVVDDLRRQHPERDVEVEIEPSLFASGDPTLLRMMLENLIGNAWKYSANARPARIGFVRHDGEPSTFTVADNGAGFDMRFADRLFGVFQRLHSASEFPGTGVGLASVRRIVRRHGGEIWAESEPDRGARFHFTLPLDSREKAALPA